jgi:hypothetical protein
LLEAKRQQEGEPKKRFAVDIMTESGQISAVVTTTVAPAEFLASEGFRTLPLEELQYLYS